VKRLVKNYAGKRHLAKTPMFKIVINRIVSVGTLQTQIGNTISIYAENTGLLSKSTTPFSKDKEDIVLSVPERVVRTASGVGIVSTLTITM